MKSQIIEQLQQISLAYVSTVKNGNDNLSEVQVPGLIKLYTCDKGQPLIGKQRVMQSNSATQFAKQKAVAFTACTEIDIDSGKLA